MSNGNPTTPMTVTTLPPPTAAADQVAKKLSLEILPYFVLGETLWKQPSVILAQMYKWLQLILAAAAAAGMGWGMLGTPAVPGTQRGSDGTSAETRPDARNGPTTSPLGTAGTGGSRAPQAAVVGIGSSVLVFIITFMRDFVQSDEKQRQVVNMLANRRKLRQQQNKLFQAMPVANPWPTIADVQSEIQKIVAAGIDDGSFPWPIPPIWVRPMVDVMLVRFMEARPVAGPSPVMLMSPDEPDEPDQRLPGGNQ